MQAEHWIKVLNEWQLRLLVLCSLLLQIFLIVTGNRRKYTCKNWLRFLLWLFYLSADSVATVALGVLSHSQSIMCKDNKDIEHCDNKDKSVDPNYVLMAFWAPFLLVHLGGPDAITAYALADNDLWLRHLLGLIGQVGIAFYVLFRSWDRSPVNYLSAVMFAAGLIKYGERTWALYSASKDHFRESMVSDPDPGPNYAKFMDDYISKKNEGYRVSLGKAIDESQMVHYPPNSAAAAEHPHGVVDDVSTLQDGFYFFATFKKLFADLILSFQDRKNSRSFFEKEDWDRAYRLVEVELGLMFDIFYTKTFQILSPLGILLRLVGVSFILLALILFRIIREDRYSTTEVVISYILLIGGVILEMYAFLIFLSTDLMTIWLSGKGTMLSPFAGIKDTVAFVTCKVVSFFRLVGAVPAKRRWSGTMGQYNFLSVSLKEKPTTFERVQKCIHIYELLQETKHRYRVDVPKGLKQLVFDQLKSRISSDVEANVQVCSLRCDQTVLKDTKCFDENTNNGVDFDQSVLIWHIATDICYVKDHANTNETSATEWLSKYVITDESSRVETRRFKREISKLLSDYMLYLLIMCPFMLPSGLGKVRFQDTEAEAKEFFKDRKCFSTTKEQACDKLLKVCTEIAPSQVKGDRSKSVLFDACRLAKSLRSKDEDENPGKNGEKWDKILHVWVDLLSFSAANCDWKEHAEQLRLGGEFLTHVWLLMAHFGLTDHFQISQGYVRAKLLLK